MRQGTYLSSTQLLQGTPVKSRTRSVPPPPAALPPPPADLTRPHKALLETEEKPNTKGALRTWGMMGAHGLFQGRLNKRRKGGSPAEYL